VTERLYYHDTELREFSATVMSVGADGSRRSIELDRTAFYPESGGQPHDTGQLGDGAVVAVEDRAGVIWHTVVGGVFEVGRVVVGRVDSARRQHHTQQHSAQHVLSAAFDRVAAHRTVSFHLGAEASTIDLDSPDVTAGVVADAERLAQTIVLQDRPVIIHFVDSRDGDLSDLRKPTERAGIIRIVEIEDFDRSACGGTHVRRTGQIGLIKIRRVERRGDTTRVEFLGGWRAIDDYSARLVSTKSIAERLSVGDLDVDGAVQRLLGDLALVRDEARDLRSRLLSQEAGELVSSAHSLDVAGRFRVARRTYVDRSPGELKQLGLLAVAGEPIVALLGTSRPSVSLVFAQSVSLPFDMSLVLRTVIGLVGGRGGGTRNLAQGGASGSASAEPAIDAAEHLLRAHCANPINVP